MGAPAMILDVASLPPARLAWGVAPKAAPGPRGNTPEAIMARAHAAAKRLPPSVEGHGGDEALLRAATEIATIVGEDAVAIAAVLRDTFNPRCLPPWPAAKIEREAAAQAAKQATPEARYGRRMAERGAAAAPPAIHMHAATAAGADFDWLAPDAPLDWYCRGLAIAPSERKVTLIAGAPGAGKGPLANYLAVCFAFGLKAFGVHACKACRVGVLDFEGARLSARRMRAYMRGFALEPHALAGRVFLRDCDPGLDIEAIADWCLARELEVLIVDSYMSAMSAYDVDPNAPEYAALARDLGALGIVVIVVSHARKIGRDTRPALGDVAGSYALGGMAATAIVAYRPDDDDHTLIRLSCARAPEDAFTAFDVRWTSAGSDVAPIWTAAIAGTATREDVEAAAAADAARTHDAEQTDRARKVIAHLAAHPFDGRTKRAITDATGIAGKDRGTDQLGGILGALERAGLARAEIRGRDTMWLLTRVPPPQVEIAGGEARVVTPRPMAFRPRPPK